MTDLPEPIRRACVPCVDIVAAVERLARRFGSRCDYGRRTGMLAQWRATPCPECPPLALAQECAAKLAAHDHPALINLMERS